MSQENERHYYRYREEEGRRTGKSWTAAEEAKLAYMWAEGWDAEAIARELDRSEPGVMGRIRIIGAKRTKKDFLCEKCGDNYIREGELIYCGACAYEPEESRKVVIIG